MRQCPGMDARRTDRILHVRQQRNNWLGDVDSNHDKQSQSLLSYR